MGQPTSLYLVLYSRIVQNNVKKIQQADQLSIHRNHIIHRPFTYADSIRLFPERKRQEKKKEQGEGERGKSAWFLIGPCGAGLTAQRTLFLPPALPMGFLSRVAAGDCFLVSLFLSKGCGSE